MHVLISYLFLIWLIGFKFRYASALTVASLAAAFYLIYDPLMRSSVYASGDFSIISRYCSFFFSHQSFILCSYTKYMPCSQIDLPYQHIYHIYYNKIQNFFKQFLCIFFILSGFAGKYDNAVRFLLLRGFQKAKLIFRFQKSASGAIRYDKLTMKPFLSRVKCVCLRKNNNYDCDVVIIFQVYVYYMIKHKKMLPVLRNV